MKIVLKQDVYNVGRVGDVKEVAAGYARNYLIPRDLAQLATPGAIKSAEVWKKSATAQQAKTDAELAELAESIKGKEVEVSVKAGSKDRIYGSVTSGDIAAALKDLVGFEVDRKRIDLKKPIHELGTFEVTVRLSSQLTPKITVIVTGE